MTHQLESRMREISQSGSEGGVADNGHPYPYPRRCAGKAELVAGIQDVD